MPAMRDAAKGTGRRPEAAKERTRGLIGRASCRRREKGGLISYGFDTVEQQRGAATYVSRVLKGEKPADLPVQAPTKYQLAINHKTAKALGLDVSWQLQQLANEVIE